MKRIFVFIAVIALLVLLAPAAHAADKTAYVNCGCANNGDGTTDGCAASGGAAGGYNSITNAIVGEQSTAFSAGDELTYYFNDDGSGSDCTMPSDERFDGFDSDLDRIILTCTPGHCHSGTFDDSLGVIASGANFVYPIYLNQAIPFTIKNLQFKRNHITPLVYIVTAVTDVTIENSIFDGSGYTGGSEAQAIRVNANTGTAVIRNNVFYDWTAASVDAAVKIQGNFVVYVVNNTGENMARFVYVASSSPTYHIANNIAQNLEGCFFDQTGTATEGATSGYNIVDYADATCTGADDEPGSNNVFSTTVTFDDEPNDDYRVTGESATVCVANNLYAHATAPVTTDFEGDARDSNTANDEYAGADTDTADSCAGGGSIIPIIMNYYRRMFGVLYIR